MNSHDGIGLQDTAQSRIQKNICHHNRGAGISVLDQACLVGSGNELEANELCGIAFHRAYLEASSDIDVTI